MMYPQPNITHNDFFNWGGKLEGYDDDRVVKLRISESGLRHFGEHSNKTMKPHGRAVRFSKEGYIYIGYFQEGCYAPGNYILLHSDGGFVVAEGYIDADGQEHERGTHYFKDGTSKEIDK